MSRQGFKENERRLELIFQLLGVSDSNGAIGISKEDQDRRLGKNTPLDPDLGGGWHDGHWHGCRHDTA